MEAVVRSWGNSLGIRIPGIIAKALSLTNGTQVSITNRGDEITIRPARKYCLTEMLDDITEDNIHKAVDWGKPVGKEIW